MVVSRSRERNGRMAEKLANEIIAASKGMEPKKEDTHRMVEANKVLPLQDLSL